MAPSTPSGPSRTYTCPYCSQESDGTRLACPGCGAPVDVKAVVAPSGWVEMPAIRDMARIEFGRSSCQIEGLYVPVADFNLAPGDGVYFAHHVVLWKDPGVAITAMPIAGGWSRMLAGLPIVMTEARGPGHIAFSRDAPGEMVALPLHPGQSVDVREHVFVAATSQVKYDFFSTGIYFSTRSGNESEQHYPLGYSMDRFKAESPGLVLIHGGGNVFERRLGPDEMILVKPTALLFKDTSVQMQLHSERPRLTSRGAFWFDRYVWVRLFGPGRVAIQSAFEHFEDRGTVLTSSPATEFRPTFGNPTCWSYAVNGETKGPIRADQLAGLIHVGSLPPDVPAWSPAHKSWTPANQLSELQVVGQLSGYSTSYSSSRTTKPMTGVQAIGCLLAFFGIFFGFPAFFALLHFIQSRSVKRAAMAEASVLQSSCDRGVFASCYTLGQKYRDGGEIPQDRVKGASLVEAACRGGYARGCKTLALAYATGDRVPIDSTRAADFWARSCEAGDVDSCVDAASRFDNGTGVPVDRVKAVQYYRKACEMGHTNVCVEAGYRLAEGKGVPRDERTAVALYRKACDAKVALGCSDLGYMVDMGRGFATASASQARVLYLQGCDGGEPVGCANLGLSLKYGQGGPKDLEGAFRLFTKSCDLKWPQGCFELGLLYADGIRGAANRNQAGPLFEKACKAQYQDACEALKKPPRN